jgi:hypothetical protein
LDNESRTPTLPTYHGVIDKVNTENSFVETPAINDINYISEGFLGRYYFKIDKSKKEIWKNVGKALAIAAVLTALVVASIFTCGAAAVAAGIATAAIFAAGGVATVAITTTAIVGAAVAGAAAFAATIPGMINVDRRNRNKEAAQEIKGRNEPIPEGYERGEKDESRQLL